MREKGKSASKKLLGSLLPVGVGYSCFAPKRPELLAEELAVFPSLVVVVVGVIDVSVSSPENGIQAKKTGPKAGWRLAAPP